ncbi:hypothetical protein G6F56_006549 [Rhizopus delemar]|nr:hypothetical protein G6F56_006549 [Rhizopus delemar]
MSSDKFRITTTNNQSLRNLNNTFFDMTLSANLTIDENNDISANNDRRSAHNALERQRREYLNSKYQELAEALPKLKTKRRPSKATIVSSSLDFVTSTLKRESSYMAEIKRLRLENETLKKQAQSSADALKKLHSEKEIVSSKRKNSQVQLSPPLTPESFKQDKKKIKLEQSPVSLPSPLGPSVSQTSFTSTVDLLPYAPSPLSTHDDINNLMYTPMNTYGHSQSFFPIDPYITPMFGSLYGSSEDLNYMNSETCMDQYYMRL